MKNPIQTFAPNELGRDFVIGDLHGSFSCFEKLLEGLNFQPEDRMFSVGDLVDRGPQSLKCLELLRDSWFHAALSNHEQMMLEAFKGGHLGEFWEQNGGNWGSSALIYRRHPALLEPKDQALLDLLPLVEELPYLITINHKNGKKFHVLHAELPSTPVPITDEVLADPEFVLQLATQQSYEGGDYFLWGRNLYYDFYGRDLSNRAQVIRMIKANRNTGLFNDQLSHVISGHTIVKRPFTIVGQTNLDTGAFNSYRGKGQLTCVNLDDWTFWQATAEKFGSVEPVVVNKSDLTD